MKIAYYKSIKVIIDIWGLIKVIINIIIRYYNFLDFIVLDKSLLFTSKFWLLLYYFSYIK